MSLVSRLLRRSSESGACVDYVSRLTGASIEDLNEAVELVQSYAIPHLAAVLCDKSDGDSLIGAHLLRLSIHTLAARGVLESRLVSKLKRDRDVWPTWAEILGAAELVQYQGPFYKVDLEPGRERGRQPDFVFMNPPRNDVFAEFKAIGLSDVEVSLHERVYPRLKDIQAPGLFVNIHVPHPRSVESDLDMQRTLARRAENRCMELSEPLRQASGIAFVVHGADTSYLRRLEGRLQECRDQFRNVPDGASCRIGVHATAHASMQSIVRWLDTADLPDKIVGLVLVGAIQRFDSDLQRYGLQIPRGLGPDSMGSLHHIAHNPAVNPTVAVALPELVELGVRITRVSLYRGRKRHEPALFRRDGLKRHFPCSLHLEADMRVMREATVAGEWPALEADLYPSWTPGEGPENLPLTFSDR